MIVGFLSDIHEDIVSLEIALQLLYTEKCEKIFCLGDIVGFAIPFYRNISIRNADACVKMVKEHCSATVIGNHDLYAIRKTPQNTAGFNYGENWYQLDYETRARRAKDKIWLYEDNELPCNLSEESTVYLNNLQEIEVASLPNISIFISHFCHPDFTGSHIHFPEEGFHLKNHFATMEKNKCVVSFSGHGHPEGCLIGTMEEIINPGFGTYTLREDQHWIVVPGIARTSRKNGVLVFDSKNMRIKTLQISK